MNLIYYNRLNESSSAVEGNEDLFLELGTIDIYDMTLKAIIPVETKDIVKVVTDAMFKISSEYRFFYSYIKYSKIFFIPNYPSSMGINTMAVDQKKNLWINAHFVYNTCKMKKERVFGILFHELMHNFFKHVEKGIKRFGTGVTKEIHMKCNLATDFEVNASMVDDGIVSKDFWKKMNGCYNPAYTGMTWEDIYDKYGDMEYEKWMKMNGIKLDDKTKAALKAIEEALTVLNDKDSTSAEKEIAGEKLKKAMDELYGKKDRKIVDKADLAGLRRELEKLMDSMLGEIGDLESDIQNVVDDLKTNPKEMDDHEVSVTISDIKMLRKNLLKNASKIGESFRKDEEDVVNDVKTAMKSLTEALNTLYEGDKEIREERKIIRQAKDDLEAIILNDLDKKRKSERRKRAIEEHKDKVRREKEKAEREAEKTRKTGKTKEERDREKAETIKDKLKKKNPIQKFVDTFINLERLYDIGRISSDTCDTLYSMRQAMTELTEKKVTDLVHEDVEEVVSYIPTLKKDLTEDFDKLIDDKILKWEKREIPTFLDDVFKDVSHFFDIIGDEDETPGAKFGAMSLAVDGLRRLGKKLKTQKKIKASEEWKKAYKETRKKLIDIYKEKGADALFDEAEKLAPKVTKTSEED
jgi:hypothetical protein